MTVEVRVQVLKVGAPPLQLSVIAPAGEAFRLAQLALAGFRDELEEEK